MSITKNRVKVKLWRVVYEIGDAEWGCTERKERHTRAVSRAAAVRNAAYHESNSAYFRVITADVVKEGEGA